jgi:hypothetical protein
MTAGSTVSSGSVLTGTTANIAFESTEGSVSFECSLDG